MFMGQQSDNVGLNKIGILVFIHHDVGISRSNFLSGFRYFSKESLPVYQQVIIIHEPVVKFKLLIVFFQIRISSTCSLRCAY